MHAPGGLDLIIILVVVLLLFGPAKLPQLARSLGQAKREFKEGAMTDEEKAAAEKRKAESKPEEPKGT